MTINRQATIRSARIFLAGCMAGLFILTGCQQMAPLQVAAPPLLFTPLPITPGQAGAPGQVGIPGQIGIVEQNAPSKVVHLPVANADVAWEKIVDVVDNYFRIERERRVQMVGKVLTEGRIDTFPQTGASVLEPHLSDSVGMSSRWESTFQTIRRRAEVRVIPEASGYLVDIIVTKELEDLPQPEQATAGGATFRHDNSLPPRHRESVSRTHYAQQWIPLGRDLALEQKILSEIEACFLGTR